jgi:hypothetical protein
MNYNADPQVYIVIECILQFYNHDYNHNLVPICLQNVIHTHRADGHDKSDFVCENLQCLFP